MKIKIYPFKYSMDKLIPTSKKETIGEVIIDGKEIKRTLSNDKKYICNGRALDSNYRTQYTIQFLDKYDDAFKYGDITINYTIWPGTSFTAFLDVNFVQKIYFKLLFEYYFFQKIKGWNRFLWEFIVFIVTIFVTWYTSKC